MPILKKLPASEKNAPGVLVTAKSGQQYNITQNPERKGKRFTLWKILPEGYERLKMADSPNKLYPAIDKAETTESGDR